MHTEAILERLRGYLCGIRAPGRRSRAERRLRRTINNGLHRKYETMHTKLWTAICTHKMQYSGLRIATLSKSRDSWRLAYEDTTMHTIHTCWQNSPKYGNGCACVWWRCCLTHGYLGTKSLVQTCQGYWQFVRISRKVADVVWPTSKHRSVTPTTILPWARTNPFVHPTSTQTTASSWKYLKRKIHTHIDGRCISKGSRSWHRGAVEE